MNFLNSKIGYFFYLIFQNRFVQRFISEDDKIKINEMNNKFNNIREDYNYIGIPKKFVDIGCIYYAPHVPNGLCRFCCNSKIKHYYKQTLVDSYFTCYITNSINT